MKRLVLLVLFSLIVSNAFAQVDTQFRWIIGTWDGDEGSEMIFRDNGTLVLNGRNFYYSIGPYFMLGGNTLRIFPQNNDGEGWYGDILYFLRINNQLMMILEEGTINSQGWLFSKRN